MSLFRKDAPEPEVTGVSVLRKRALNCVRRLDYSLIARDLGTTADRFRDFAERDGDLPVEVMRRMTRYLFEGIELTDDGMFRSTNKDAEVVCKAGLLPPYDPATDPKRYVYRRPQAVLEKPEPPKPDPFKRAGLAV